MSVIDNLEELLAVASPGPWEAIGPMNNEHAKRLEEGSAFTCWVYSSADEVATFDAHELEQNFANACLVAIVRPLVQALVESQEYIEEQDCQNRRDYGGDFCIEWPKSNREDWCDRCVALDDFEKVIER